MLQKVPDYPKSGSKYEEWQNYYEHMLEHLEELKSRTKRVIGKELVVHDRLSLALQYVFTSFLPFFSDFTEGFLMMHQATIERVLKQMLSLQDKIQNCFNAQSDDKNEDKALEALKCYFGGTLADGTHTDGIKKLLEEHGHKEKPKEKEEYRNGESLFSDENEEILFSNEFISSVKEQFKIIFHVNEVDKDASVETLEKMQGDLATYWHGLWNNHDIDPEKGGPQNLNSIQPVSHALSAVVSNFSSQSSIVQSHLKLDEANDEQWQSMTHDMMKAYVDVERHAISLQHGG